MWNLIPGTRVAGKRTEQFLLAEDFPTSLNRTYLPPGPGH